MGDKIPKDFPLATAESWAVASKSPRIADRFARTTGSYACVSWLHPSSIPGRRGGKVVQLLPQLFSKEMVIAIPGVIWYLLAAVCSKLTIHSLAKVVLPKPAGAEIKLGLLPFCNP